MTTSCNDVKKIFIENSCCENQMGTIAACRDVTLSNVHVDDLNVNGLGLLDRLMTDGTNSNYNRELVTDIVEEVQRNYDILGAERYIVQKDRARRRLENNVLYDYIVCGAGSAGAGTAYRLAKNHDKRVLVVERGEKRTRLYRQRGNRNAAYMSREYGNVYNTQLSHGPIENSNMVSGWNVKPDGPYPNYTYPVSGFTTTFSPSDPRMMGGASTFNGGVSHLMSDWVLEKMFSRARVAVDWSVWNDVKNSLKKEHLRSPNYYVKYQGEVLGETFENTSVPWIESVKHYADKYAEFTPYMEYGMGGTVPENGGTRGVFDHRYTFASGFSKNFGSAIWLEEFENGNDNLDIIYDAMCDKIMFDTSGTTPVANNVSLKIYDSIGNLEFGNLVSLGKDQTALLKEGGKVVLAGNIYQTPAILERSGIGDPDVLSEAGIPLLVDNAHVGNNLHNNIYLRPSIYAETSILGPTNDKLMFASEYDPRSLGTFSQNIASTVRSNSNRGSVKIAWRTGGSAASGIDDIECHGLRTRGSTHINPNNHFLSMTSNGWENNGASEDERNKHGLVECYQHVYDFVSGRVGKSAKYKYGTGRKANGMLASVQMTPETNMSFSLNEDSVAGLVADPVTGVYVSSGVGGDISTRTRDEIATSLQSMAQDSIHWSGTASLGPVLDEKFAVRGVEGVHVSDSSSMNMAYPYNNWISTAMMGHYVGSIILSNRSPPEIPMLDSTMNTLNVNGIPDFLMLQHNESTKLTRFEYSNDAIYTGFTISGTVFCQSTAESIKCRRSSDTIAFDDFTSDIDVVLSENTTLVVTDVLFTLSANGFSKNLAEIEFGLYDNDVPLKSITHNNETVVAGVHSFSSVDAVVNVETVTVKFTLAGHNTTFDENAFGSALASLLSVTPATVTVSTSYTGQTKGMTGNELFTFVRVFVKASLTSVENVLNSYSLADFTTALGVDILETSSPTSSKSLESDRERDLALLGPQHLGTWKYDNETFPLNACADGFRMTLAADGTVLTHNPNGLLLATASSTNVPAECYPLATNLSQLLTENGIAVSRTTAAGLINVAEYEIDGEYITFTNHEHSAYLGTQRMTYGASGRYNYWDATYGEYTIPYEYEQIDVDTMIMRIRVNTMLAAQSFIMKRQRMTHPIVGTWKLSDWNQGYTRGNAGSAGTWIGWQDYNQYLPFGQPAGTTFMEHNGDANPCYRDMRLTFTENGLVVQNFHGSGFPLVSGRSGVNADIWSAPLKCFREDQLDIATYIDKYGVTKPLRESAPDIGNIVTSTYTLGENLGGLQNPYGNYPGNSDTVDQPLEDEIIPMLTIQGNGILLGNQQNRNGPVGGNYWQHLDNFMDEIIYEYKLMTPNLLRLMIHYSFPNWSSFLLERVYEPSSLTSNETYSYTPGPLPPPPAPPMSPPSPSPPSPPPVPHYPPGVATGVVTFAPENLKGWTVTDGTLCTATRVDDYVEPLSNMYFQGSWEFTVEVKLPPESNSGIFYFVHNDAANSSIGIEYQVVTEESDDHTYSAGTRTFGALYGLLPSSIHPTYAGRGDNLWNSVVIRKTGDIVKHMLNGVTLLSYSTNDKTQIIANRDRTNPLWDKSEGRIQLQHHGEVGVCYRNPQYALL